METCHDVNVFSSLNNRNNAIVLSFRMNTKLSVTDKNVVVIMLCYNVVSSVIFITSLKFKFNV